MAREIRLGLVGYGRSRPKAEGPGRTGRGEGLLLLATTAFEGVRAVGICDNSPGALDQARAAFPGARHFPDIQAMLSEVPMDALLVETPAHLHAEFAVKALERDIHVLSDIPCVHTLDEASALWAAQQKSQAFYMAGANANFKGFIETGLDLKRRGLLGEPYYVEAAYVHDCREFWADSPWRKTLEPILYCTHSLGPVLRLVDEDLEWATCFDTGSHINREAGQHDAMAALFRTKSSVVVHLLTSFIHNSPIGYQHMYRFFTTKGAFERTLAYPTFQSTEHAAQQRTLFYSTELYGYRNWIELPIDGYTRPEHAKEKDTGHAGLDYAMLAAFVEAVRAGGPSPISLKEGLRMTLPGIYAAESARKGGELVRIRYPWTQD